jgi:hypothetical protein
MMSLVADEMDANPILRLTSQLAPLHVLFFPSSDRLVGRPIRCWSEGRRRIDVHLAGDKAAWVATTLPARQQMDLTGDGDDTAGRARRHRRR